MGVQGLWSLLNPAARPTQLDSLRQKRIAVDASIWIHQFMRTMRDKEGNALRNGHLLGFFRRLCKLLFFDIKPVFVFDGGAPILKRSTIIERRKRREGIKVNLRATAKKILQTQMKARVLLEQEKKLHGQDEKFIYAAELEKTAEVLRKPLKLDQYELPDIPKKESYELDPRLATREEIQQFVDEFTPSELDSDTFQSLPPELQYEVIQDLKIKSRQTSWARLDQMVRGSTTALDFSKYQIKSLKHRNTMTQRLMQMNTVAGGNTTSDPSRIAGERGKEYILYKNEDIDQGLGWKLPGLTASEPVDLDPSPHSEPKLQVPAEIDNESEPVDKVQAAIASNPRLAALFSDYLDDEEEKREAEILDREMDKENDESEEPLMNDMGAYMNEENDAINQVISRIYPIQDSPQVEQDLTLTLDVDDFYRLWVSRMPDAFVYLHSLNDEHLSIIRSAIEEDEIDTLRRQLKSIRKQRGKTNEIDELALESFQFHEAFLESVIAWNERNFEEQLEDFEKQEIEQIIDVSDEEDIQFESLPIQRLSSEEVMDEELTDLDGKIIVSDEELSEEQEKDEERSEEQEKDEELSKDQEKNEELSEDQEKDEELSKEQEQNKEVSLGLKASDNKDPVGSPDVTITDDEAVVVDEDDDDMDIHFVDAPPGLTDLSPQENIDTEHVHIDIQQSLLHAGELDLGKQAKENDLKTERNKQLEEAIQVEENKEEIDAEQIQIGYNSEDELEENIGQEDDEFARFVSDIASKNIEDIRNNLQRDMEELNQAQKKNMGNSDDITGQMIQDIQELLKLFGIPYMVAPMEAEAQCAELESLDLVDGTITDDSDVFLFGAGRVYKNMFNQQRFVECYHSKDIDREMLLNRQKLIQLAFLLGSDYTEGIPGVGPVTAMEILFEFSETPEEPLEAPLERFRDWYNGKVDDTPFQKKFRKQHSSLEIPEDFPNPLVTDAYYNPTVDKSDQKFEWGQPQLDSLRTFLTEAFGWSEEKADEVLLPVLREMNSRKAAGEQQVIGAYFNPSGNTKSSTHKHSSKRVQNIVEMWRKQKKPKNV